MKKLTEEAHQTSDDFIVDIKYFFCGCKRHHISYS